MKNFGLAELYFTKILLNKDGRYDASDPGDMPGISWVLSDDPFTPRPVEIFMREYYEPRLLQRLLAGEKLPPIKSIGDLNRTQPSVVISDISHNGNTNRVSVDIEVSSQSQGTVSAEKGGGVYDLRLFRNGQLVGSFPEEHGRIVTETGNGKRRINFKDIQLSTVTDKNHVTFSAYAFNGDGVKSATYHKDFLLPTETVHNKRRAYIIAIGINAYENPAWDLRYAASDATAIDKIVKKQLVETGILDEVISIPLIARYETSAGSREGLEGPPVTAALVRNVLQRLSSRDDASAKTDYDIPGINKIQPATPDDLLLITYSGHGLADKGEFYMFPYDIGPGDSREVDEALLHHAISSEELSAWSRHVDAGEILMIIDACNSAASVEGEGFKPSPMGSRGLGQLAYDKGMRILTASQAESVALESDQIRHGALTYALIREGLEAGLADNEPKDKRITAVEWLRFGMSRVPNLYGEIRSGEVASAGRGKVIRLSGDQDDLKKVDVQQPGLFDFNKLGRETVISLTGERSSF
mgnify:CR=1 FL=1